MKIVILEKDNNNKGNIDKILEEGHFKIVKTSATKEIFEKIKTEKADIVILDLDEETGDALKICKTIKKDEEIYDNPVIVVFSYSNDIDKLSEILENGADDYIRKPYIEKEVIARLHSIIRRKFKNLKDEYYYYKNIKVSEEEVLVKAGDDYIKIEIQKKELELLYYLVKNCGEVMTRDSISRKLWDREYIPGERGVDIYISRLKKRIPVIGESLKMERGIGYRLK